MKKNMFFNVKSDLWVLVMDIIAVNAAHLLALLLRYYVNSQIVVSAAHRYMEIYMRFAPFYTIICIVVFMFFRLYNGIWRYASIDDMNRIIGACLTTTVINLLGTLLLFQKLPYSYYVIGAAFQYVFVSVIRFSYRFLMIGRGRIKEAVNPSLPVIVIGGNESGEKVITYLEQNSAFKAIAVVDANVHGNSIHGLPVINDAEKALDVYQVRNVVIADSLMPDRKREQLRRICDSKGVALHDYSWLVQKRLDNISLTELTKVIRRPFKVRFRDTLYDSIDEAMEKLNNRYTVVDIDGNDLVIEIREMTVDAMPEPSAKKKSW